MEKISILEDWIQRRGSDDIRKVIFFFRVRDPIQYPYGVHTFVLERIAPSSTRFRVQFYHYYNPSNQRISQSDEQNYLDFCTILGMIYHHDLLSTALGPYIVDPFFKTNEEGLLC